MTPFTARTPVDLIAVVPFVLGFHPQDSVVMLTFGAAETFHARVDLPTDPDEQEDVVEMLSAVLARHGVRRVALLLYTEDPWVAAGFHDIAVARFITDRVRLVAVLRVGREHFHDAGDPEDPGAPYDVRTHPFTAERVLEGTVVHHDRAELAATLDPVDEQDARLVVEEAERVADELLGAGHATGLATEARWVQHIIRRHVAAGTPLLAADAGRLLLLVRFIEVRDVAWAEMTRAEAQAHVELWRDLVRRCPRDLLPAASALLAFAAWLAGHGALAWCALDKCAEVDPDYSMADCISSLLEGAVAPSVWTPIPESDLPVLAGRRRAS